MTHLTKIFLVTLILFGTICPGKAQTQAPATEMRAVWVASVYGLDWPNGNDRIYPERQKEDLRQMLDSAVAWNLNTIFLQVRPMADALYQSDLAPWSVYASGSRGNYPGYDPLQFAIEEAHKRGLELHGWLNPYRYETSIGMHDGKPGDFNAEHPEWMLTYSDIRIFNPGVPEVMQHLTNIVGEIVNNYDVDGIHFDDYFYRYEGGTTTEDLDTYETYGGAFDDISDWRRNNVNTMIQMVHDTIQSVKPYVRFGISPFGIFGDGRNPEGIIGLDAYNHIYTDPEQWLKNESVDYLCPQLYWPTGGSQDFSKLLPFWAELTDQYNRPTIAGHGIHRYDNNPAPARTSFDPGLHELKQYVDLNTGNENARIAAWTLQEISDQINIVRDNMDKGAAGSAYFRFDYFNRVNGLKEQIVNNHYQHVSLLPIMDWEGVAAPAAPANIRWDQDAEGITYLTWDRTDDLHRYVVYASNSEVPTEATFEDPSNIMRVTYDTSFYLSDANLAEDRVSPYIFVRTYDRYGNLSDPSDVLVIAAPNGQPALIAPSNGASDVGDDFYYSWDGVEEANFYRFELSTSPDFSTIEYTTDVVQRELSSLEYIMESQTEYFWRIKPMSIGGEGPSSEVFSFTTAFPDDVVITAPEQNEQYVDLQPTLSWEKDKITTNVLLEIARGGTEFQPYNVVYTRDLGSVSEHQVEDALKEWTTYHFRVKAYNAAGLSQWVYSSFKTQTILPEAPAIYTPQPSTELQEGEDVAFTWSQTENASQYEAVLTRDKERTDIIQEYEGFSKTDTSCVFTSLAPGAYYLSVSGKNVGGNGEWAQETLVVKEVLSVNGEDRPVAIYYTGQNEIIIQIDRAGLDEVEVALFDLMSRRVPVKLRKSAGNLLEIRINREEIGGIGILQIKSASFQQSFKVLGN